MQTRPFPSTPDARSPAGAEIRHLIEGETGGMIHSTVPPGQVNRATVHATVSEFWHVLSGEGQIWRRDGSGEETTVLGTGVSIDIPVGTAFQYRCTGVDPLKFLCITMPRWPGDREATVIEGPWNRLRPKVGNRRHGLAHEHGSGLGRVESRSSACRDRRSASSG